MSTIVDDLLQDFESDEDADLEPDTGAYAADHGSPQDNDESDIKDEEMGGTDGADPAADSEPQDDAAQARARVENMWLGGVKDVRSVSSLMQTLQPVLQKIAQYQAQPSESSDIGSVEDNPEYTLLTQSNGLSTQIDSEIMVVHKFIRDHYSVRFPELESLISNPLEYAKVVAIIGNGPMDTTSINALQTSASNPLGVTLRSVLDGPTLMIVTVEATTTQGREVSGEELQRIFSACEMVMSLDKAKQTLTDYVQSRLNLFAPNLTALVGSLTAAQLLNAAGGLTGLSKTPACNIPAWGSKKQQSAGLATNVGIRQQGFLYHSGLIRDVPTDLKRQAMRIVSAKLVLAARVDRVHKNRDGSMGDELRASCLERLEKLTAPPPNKGHRALPAPDDKPARKRGGRRARKAKETTAMTELRKSQNRMAFGKEEKEVGYGTGEETVGLGMIGQAGDGRIRSTQIDQRTRAKLGAKSRGWGGAGSTQGGATSTIRAMSGSGMELGRGLRTSGVGSTMGGTASSLAFSPAQGLELVDPKIQAQLKRKWEADEDRWFKGGTFTQVGNSADPSSTNGGFKVPDLPANKKVDTGSGKMGPPPPLPHVR